MRYAGEDEADCEELKYVPQGPDTTLLVTTGEKALAVKTRNTVSIISLRPTGEVGIAYTTPGQRPSAEAGPKHRDPNEHSPYLGTILPDMRRCGPIPSFDCVHNQTGYKALHVQSTLKARGWVWLVNKENSPGSMTTQPHDVYGSPTFVALPNGLAQAMDCMLCICSQHS